MPEFLVKARVTRTVEMLVIAPNEQEVWNENYDFENERELETEDMDILSVELNK